MTATIVLAAHAQPHRARDAATGGGSSAVAATALSIAGSAVAFLIAGLGLLTAPAAAALVFGPALLELL